MLFEYSYGLLSLKITSYCSPFDEQLEYNALPGQCQQIFFFFWGWTNGITLNGKIKFHQKAG
jgi:hypothetical protein